MIRSPLLALAILAALGATACGEKTPGPSASTENLAQQTDPNTYVAAKYGMTATAPEGWYVMDSAVTKKLMDVGRDTATAASDAEAKAAFDASLERSENIFGFLETDPNTSTEGGAGILAIAEDVTGATDVANGRDYFGHLSAAFQQTGTNVTVDNNFTTAQVDGKTFDRMNIVMHGTAPDGSAVQVNQRYLAAKHDKYMIVFIQSYVDDSDIAVLDSILNSVKLDWK